MTEDFVTIIEAVGDSWPAALVVVVGILAVVWMKSLPNLKNLSEKVDEVHHEVYPNSGKSMADAVFRTAEGVESVKADLAGTNNRLAALEAWQVEHEKFAQETIRRLLDMNQQTADPPS